MVNKKYERQIEVEFNGKYIGEFVLKETGSYLFHPDLNISWHESGMSESDLKYILDKLQELNKEINDVGQ